jgi:hypothetical protein
MRCSVCDHPERDAIERALIGSVSVRDIAGRYGASRSAVGRHKLQHLPAKLVKAKESAEVARVTESVRDEIGQALDVIQQLKAINVACLEVLKKARTVGDDVTLLRSVDRIHRQIELQARLLGELQDAPQVNVLVLPEWHRLRVVVVQALKPYPEARDAVVRALHDAGA